MLHQKLTHTHSIMTALLQTDFSTIIYMYHHHHYHFTVASSSSLSCFTVPFAWTHSADCLKKKNDHKKKSKVQKVFVGFSLKKSKLIKGERPKARQFPACAQCVHTSIHYNTCGIARPITKISLATLRHVSNTIKRFWLLEYDFNYSLFTISLISQREMAQWSERLPFLRERQANSGTLQVSVKSRWKNDKRQKTVPDVPSGYKQGLTQISSASVPWYLHTQLMIHAHYGWSPWAYLNILGIHKLQFPEASNNKRYWAHCHGFQLDNSVCLIG